jgi:hypothetical protein
MQINHREILYVLNHLIIHKARKKKTNYFIRRNKTGNSLIIIFFFSLSPSDMSLIKRIYTTMICLFVSIKKERLSSSLFELVIVIDEAIHRQVLDRLYARFDLLIDKKNDKFIV